MSLDDRRRPCATIGCPYYIAEHDATAPFCSRCHSERARAAAALVTATGVHAGEIVSVEVSGGWIRRACEEDGLLIARGDQQIFVPAGQAEVALQEIGRCLPDDLGGGNGRPAPEDGPGELPVS